MVSEDSTSRVMAKGLAKCSQNNRKSEGMLTLASESLNEDLHDDDLCNSNGDGER